MLELYSTPPTSNDEDAERSTWKLNEQYERNRNTALMFIVGGTIGFVISLQLASIVLLALASAIVGYVYTKNKQDAGWKQYWKYYTPHLDTIIKTSSTKPEVTEAELDEDVDQNDEPETYDDIRQLVTTYDINYANFHYTLAIIFEFLDWAPSPTGKDLETLAFCINKLTKDCMAQPWARYYLYKLSLLKAMLAFAQEDWATSRRFVNKSIKEKGSLFPEAKGLLASLNEKQKPARK